MRPHSNPPAAPWTGVLLAALLVGCSGDSPSGPQPPAAPGPAPPAAPAEAETLEKVSGDGQMRAAGAELPGALIVRLLDTEGEPVSGATVSFEVTAGDGSLSTVSASTDAAGEASSLWTLGPEAGAQEVTARHGDLDPVSFTAQALALEVAIAGPSAGERFLSEEAVSLGATLTGDPVPADSVVWTSSRDGELGRGLALQVTGLSPGAHEITASVLGVSRSTGIRAFADLWDLFRSEPAPTEVARILADFTIEYVDGPEADEKWAAYGFDFNPGTGTASRLVIVAKLDVLRRQRFDERPTFTDAHETVYEWLRSLVHTIRVDMGRCGDAFGGGGSMTLHKNFAFWGPVGTVDGACQDRDDLEFFPYDGPLSLVVHEARHSDTDDPRHTVCENGVPGDATLEGGSGYAWAATYLMWVYKHGRFDPPVIRYEETGTSVPARRRATSLLELRICGEPTHSDPRVQDIVNELLGE